MSTTFGDNHPNQTESKNLKQTNHLSHYTWSETDLGHFTSLYILRQISTWGVGEVKDLPLLSVCHQAVVLPWRSSAPVWKRWKHHSGWQFSGCATRRKPKVPCFPKCVFSPGSMEKTVDCADCFNFAVFPWTNSLNTKCLFSIVFIGLHSLLFIIYACWHPDFFRRMEHTPPHPCLRPTPLHHKLLPGKENVFGWQNSPVVHSLPLHITKPEVISSKLGTSRLKGWNLFFTVPYDVYINFILKRKHVLKKLKSTQISWNNLIHHVFNFSLSAEKKNGDKPGTNSRRLITIQNRWETCVFVTGRTRSSLPFVEDLEI